MPAEKAYANIEELNQSLISCQRCPRLVAWREKVAQEKVRRYAHEPYWGKPVPAIGTISGRLWVLGLAPAAHGANRTGRMFTGDSSGDWLFKALHQTGFANQPTSTHAQDGLELNDVYITGTAHCAPPQNKLQKAEILNCRHYVNQEHRLAHNKKVILVLGRIAFENYCQLQALKGLSFGHNVTHKLTNGTLLVCSYHPSKQNTQTGRLSWQNWLNVFLGIRQHLDFT